MHVGLQCVVLAVISVCGARLAYEVAGTRILATDTVVAAEAAHMEPLWVDARSANAYAAGTIPGALSLPPEAWDAGLVNVLMAWEPDVPLVVFCASRDCGTSETVAARLRDVLPEARVYILEGGWEAWTQAR